jgi:epoxyqueuosine reductase
MTTKQKIKQFLLDSGASVCGVAAAADFAAAPHGFRPTDIFVSCRSVVVFGLALPRALMRVDPRLIYMKAMLECLAELDRLALLAAVFVEKYGFEALPLPSDEPVGSWNEKTKTAKGMLSLKHAGELAGLGRIGKNTLLINPRFGNRLMLGCILTDLALESDAPAASLCPPRCRICLDNCPQAALGGGTLDQSRCRQLIYARDGHGQPINQCNACRRLCPQSLRRPPLAERPEPD